MKISVVCVISTFERSLADVHKKVVLWQRNRRMPLKFYTYRNLQQHRTVAPVIARFSCIRTNDDDVVTKVRRAGLEMDSKKPIGF